MAALGLEASHLGWDRQAIAIGLFQKARRQGRTRKLLSKRMRSISHQICSKRGARGGKVLFGRQGRETL